MMRPFQMIRDSLWLWAVMSSLWLTVWASVALAHEVVPTIADLSVEGDVVRLEMRVNLAAQLSGIDLDAVSDTDDAENVADYDALRDLSVGDIAGRVDGLVATWNTVPMLVVAQTPVPWTLEGVMVPDVTNAELARISDVILTGVLPTGADSVQINWPAGAGDLVLRQQGVDEPYTGLIAGGEDSGAIALAGGNEATGWQTFVGYIPVGFDHILPKGLDHILFVLGLFFLSVRLGALLWQISAFTLAHTVTLAMGALGVVNVPGSIVEPLIAASIVYVAVENIFARKLNPWRPVIVFCFGLLHGLGFASVLGEFGLPSGQFVPALIGFNIGVELGQLTVIAIAFAAVGWLGGRDWYRRLISIPASCAIAAVGAYWVVERVFF